MECYLPPSDKEGVAQRLLLHAIRAQPKGTRLLILYNLNTDLDIPRTAQEDVLAAEMTDLGLSCSTRDYVSSTTQYVRGRRPSAGQPTRRRRSGDGRGASRTTR